MKLYHGTSEVAAREALRSGLLPRMDRPSQWKMASAKDRVYLTDAYAMYFAFNATKENEERWAVIEIDTDQLDAEHLIPDEDFLEQATRNNPDSGCPRGLGTMIQRTKWFRKHASSYQNYWRDSLKGLGTCAHIGPIPPSAITQVALFEPKSNPYISMRALDPTITLMNYKVVGGSYRALVQWLFRSDVTPESILGYDVTRALSPPWFAEQVEAASHALAKREGIKIITR